MTPPILILSVVAIILCIALVWVANVAVRFRSEAWEQEKRKIELENQISHLEDVKERENRLVSNELELARISGLSAADAKQEYLEIIGKEAQAEAENHAREIDENILSETRKRLLDSMEKCAMQTVVENSTAVVELPSEDVKGRIIGREGRNIRSFEQITGVDLIIDETPETVMISSFDPIRRETARLTLMNLIVDGRIHPAKIEELHDKAKQEIHRTIVEAGQRAAQKAGIGKLPKPVIETLGKLRFRSSYAQNVLDHSVEVAHIGATIATELGLSAESVKRAGLLHDIGKALGDEWEGPHALTGMAYLKQHGESELILNAVGAHHREIEPSSAEAQIVIVADILSASRPGARRENLETYLKRMTTLEAIANGFKGVEKSYAVQAGREIRVVVKPEEIGDREAKLLATNLGNEIKKQIDVSGQIKIVVIRESRFTEILK